ARRYQHRPVRSLSAEYHAIGPDAQLAGHLMATRPQQDRAAEAVGVEWQARDIVDGRLDARRAISRHRRDDDPNRRLRDGHASAAVAAMREIRDAIPSLIRLVDQPAIAARIDESLRRVC